MPQSTPPPPSQNLATYTRGGDICSYQHTVWQTWSHLFRVNTNGEQFMWKSFVDVLSTDLPRIQTRSACTCTCTPIHCFHRHTFGDCTYTFRIITMLLWVCFNNPSFYHMKWLSLYVTVSFCTAPFGSHMFANLEPEHCKPMALHKTRTFQWLYVQYYTYSVVFPPWSCTGLVFEDGCAWIQGLPGCICTEVVVHY